MSIAQLSDQISLQLGPSISSPLHKTYTTTLLIELICLSFSLISISIPRWLRSMKTFNQDGVIVRICYGLNSKCTFDASDSFFKRNYLTCSPFPEEYDCDADSELPCVLWKTATFCMFLSILVQLSIVIAILNSLYGGKKAFENGWKIIVMLLLLTIILQAYTTFQFVGFLETYSQFIIGWRLGASWGFAVVSWVISVIVIVVLSVVGSITPHEYTYYDENDYEIYYDDVY